MSTIVVFTFVPIVECVYGIYSRAMMHSLTSLFELTICIRPKPNSPEPIIITEAIFGNIFGSETYEGNFKTF